MPTEILTPTSEARKSAKPLRESLKKSRSRWRKYALGIIVATAVVHTGFRLAEEPDTVLTDRASPSTMSVDESAARAAGGTLHGIYQVGTDRVRVDTPSGFCVIGELHQVDVEYQGTAQNGPGFWMTSKTGETVIVELFRYVWTNPICP